jgi:hypothetical protein
MSEFKQITDEEIYDAACNAIELNPYETLSAYEFSICYAAAAARLAQCKADQKEERRALGELLNERYSGFPGLDAIIEALKQGTLPEGIKEGE